MKITRVSPLTRKATTLNIDVTEDQLNQWRDGMHIQNAMPHLTADEREFIMTGYTSEDWKAIFGEGA